MLTPFVLALAFANYMSAAYAYPYTALIGASASHLQPLKGRTRKEK
jgi:hypothetical protein